jgi:FixJ family two-component response regulator
LSQWLKVWLLTGQASLEASIRTIKDGVYRFLTKPIEPAELRRVISGALALGKRASGERPEHSRTGVLLGSPGRGTA